jgi:hypothetical protein
MTAQTLVVQTITSSISVITGSTKFGTLNSNTHQFTGSLNVTGSLSVVTTGTELQVTNTGVNLGNVLTDSHVISGSLTVNPGGLFVTSSGNVGIGTTSPNIGGYSANSRLLTIQGTAGSYGILELTSNSANADGSAIGRLDFGSDGQAANYKAISSIASFLTGSTSTKFGADLRFYTRGDNAGSGDPSERMRITAAGNVGIGSSSPADYFSRTLTIDGSSSQGIMFRASGTDRGFLFQDGSFIQLGSNAGGVIFKSNDTERIRITNGGNLLFTGGVSTGVTDTKFLMISQGTTSSTYAIVAKQSNNSTNLFALRDDGLFQTGLATNSPYNASISGRSAVIDSSGTLGYTSSTRESKTNIEQLSNVSWIYELNPVSFNYRKKDDENNYTDEAQEEKWYGLIADEVESVNQDLVFYNTKEDGTKTLAGVEYNKLISSLVKAIQELKAEIDALKAQ